MVKSIHGYLQRERKYSFRDEYEFVWRFAWGAANGEEGWWGWRKKVNEDEWKCLGIFAESEVLYRLEKHHSPLTDDDRLDLHLWLEHDGLVELVRNPMLSSAKKVKLVANK